MRTSVARALHAALNRVALVAYRAPEPAEALRALGLKGWARYFCPRAAAMGRVAPSVVAAAFYNYNPHLVAEHLRWDVAPEVIVATRAEASGRALRGALGEAGIAEIVPMLKGAVAAAPVGGRPLAAAHAALDVLGDEFAALWHLANVLREHRGDGHVLVLASHAVGPVEALCLHAAYQGRAVGNLPVERGWTEKDVARAHESLRERGMVDAERAITDAGWKFREMIEMETDRLAAPPYEATGEPERILALAEPLAERLRTT